MSSSPPSSAPSSPSSPSSEESSPSSPSSSSSGCPPLWNGYENFLCYTELDANNHIGVDHNILDVNGITTSEDAWLYRDMGAGHFGATFEHDIKVTPRTSVLDSNCVVWAGSNVINNRKYWVDNGSQALSVFVNYITGHGYRFYLENNEAPRTVDYTADFFASADTPYYLTIERTSDTSISCRIYSDAARTAPNLLDTLTVAITAGRTYRHIAVVVSANMGTGKAFSCDIENLDLNEPTPIAIFHHHCKLLARP